MGDSGDIGNIESLLLSRLKSAESELVEARAAVLESRKREVSTIDEMRCDELKRSPCLVLILNNMSMC